MENSQSNKAQREYEAGLEDSQPATAPTDYELAQQITPSEWRMDFAEYLMGKDNIELAGLLGYIRAALFMPESDFSSVGDRMIGECIRRHFTDYLRKTKGAV